MLVCHYSFCGNSTAQSPVRPAVCTKALRVNSAIFPLHSLPSDRTHRHSDTQRPFTAMVTAGITALGFSRPAPASVLSLLPSCPAQNRNSKGNAPRRPAHLRPCKTCSPVGGQHAVESPSRCPKASLLTASACRLPAHSSALTPQPCFQACPSCCKAQG